jgi:uncharacterized protein YbjT (DUF2867 family)
LPGVEFVHSDLDQAAALDAAVRSVDAIVFTDGGSGSPDEARRVDYGGVANVSQASTADHH